MISLVVNVKIEDVELVPVARNIYTEFDNMMTIFGVRRFIGEKISSFKDFAYLTSRIGMNDSEAIQLLLCLEARIPFQMMFIENSNWNRLIVTVRITSTHKLIIETYVPNIHGIRNFYIDTYEYDLLDKEKRVYLSELAAEITQIEDVRAYVAPFLQESNKTLLCTQLCEATNIEWSSCPAFATTKFALPNKHIVPDTITVQFNVSQSDNDSPEAEEQFAIADISEDRHYHIDYWKGLITTGSDWSRREAVIRYAYAKPVQAFLVTPYLELLGSGKADVVARMSANFSSSGAGIQYRKRHTGFVSSEQGEAILRGVNKDVRGLIISHELTHYNRDKWA